MHDFEHIAMLGYGSFGHVSVVCESKSTEYFAVKAMAKSKLSSPKLATQIVRERILASAFSHPFLASFKMAFQDQKMLYLVSEFVPGGELWYHVYGSGKAKCLSPDAVRFYAANVALALDYMHNHGIQTYSRQAHWTFYFENACTIKIQMNVYLREFSSCTVDHGDDANYDMDIYIYINCRLSHLIGSLKLNVFTLFNMYIYLYIHRYVYGLHRRDLPRFKDGKHDA
jgi:serine/threonine protein kinase